MSPQKKPLPAPTLDAVRCFKSWRPLHTAREGIPEGLWNLTTRLPAEFGVNWTARTLRLDYARLKHERPVITVGNTASTE